MAVVLKTTAFWDRPRERAAGRPSDAEGRRRRRRHVAAAVGREAGQAVHDPSTLVLTTTCALRSDVSSGDLRDAARRLDTDASAG